MQPGQNPFTNPTAPGGSGLAPRVSDMEGCLVAFSPRVFTAAGTGDNLTGFGKDAPRDRVTTDIFLLETPRGPIRIGGTPETDSTKPHTHTVMGPARFTGVWVNSSNIVKALAPGGQPLVGSMVLGRIQRSDVGMKPWNLVSVEGTPDMAKAVELYSALNMGALAWNEPQPLGGGFAAGPGAVTYGQPSAPVNYPGAAAAGWPNATPPAQQTAPQGPPSGFAPPVDPAYAAWQAQQAQAAAIQQAGNAAVAAAFPGAQVIAGHPQTPPPGPAAGSMAVPQGWDPQVWYGLSDQQRAEVLRSLGQ